MHVCIIGAGASGLAAAKYLLEKNNKFTCDILERNEDLGGTWYYTDEVGTDKYGYPIYACMYKNLRTNLPKEVMGYSSYKFPEQDQSYISQEDVLEHLKNFAKQFNLRPLIKFSTMVTAIHSLANDRWSITSTHIPSKAEATQDYDAVIVCSGHFNEGSYPNIPGRDIFKHKQLHSHDYRKPEPYNGKKILVIGAGPSGLDLTAILSAHAQSVIISHHANQPLDIEFPANVTKKPDVTRITENGVEFSDGISAELDAIIYCTGYKYRFPFLCPDTKLGVEDDVFVTPLYKHIINIEHPTMALTGIPSTACSIPMYDLQVRFYVEYLNGSMQLPSKEQMYADLNADIKKRKEMGLPKKKWHLMNVDFVWDYYKSLADAARIENTWPSIVKLRLAAAKEIGKNLFEYRKDRYRIVDKENYIKLN